MFFKKRKKEIIHLYTICWNEEYMLKYFFKYYDKIVDRYVFFDDGSTDTTLDILKEHPNVEVRKLPRVGEGKDSYVLAAQEVHNNCWKESRGIADWVIVTAVDEFLYMPRLRSYLAECTRNGITVIPALGFQMISEILPKGNKSMPRLVKRGCPWVDMNKLSIFNPNKIEEANHHVGRHSSGPRGEVKYPSTDRLLNLHYKYLSFETTFKRHSDLQEKLGSLDKKNAWGIQYSWSRDRFKESWDYFMNNSVKNIFAWNYSPGLQHSRIEERWWRKINEISENNNLNK
jgi:glycosyltransferase involved in cell wall biosynthesis